MLKIGKLFVYLTISAISAITSAAFAQANGFTVEGFVTYTKTDDIYIKLMNQEQFERDVEGKDPQTPFALLLKTDPNGNKGKISFKFNDVPKGIYAISFYQDVNGNEKCDMGMFGPKEPWGMYKVKPHFKPVFTKLAFELNGDLTNLALEAK